MVLSEEHISSKTQRICFLKTQRISEVSIQILNVSLLLDKDLESQMDTEKSKES